MYTWYCLSRTFVQNYLMEITMFLGIFTGFINLLLDVLELTIQFLHTVEEIRVSKFSLQNKYKVKKNQSNQQPILWVALNLGEVKKGQQDEETGDRLLSFIAYELSRII